MNAARNVSWRALRVWQRNADVLRETFLFNFLPPALEPVLYLLAFGFGVGSLVGTVAYQGQVIPYRQFMAAGMIGMAVLYQSYFETTYSTFVRMYYQRTFDAIIATPLLIEDVIAGEWIWGGTKAFLNGSITLAVLSAFGLVSYPSGLLILPVVIVGGLLFSALGLVTTAIAPNINAFNLPMFLFVFPMFLFGGTFFPLDVLPPWAMDVAMALPLTHVCLLVRGACLATPPPHMLASIAYLVLVTPPLAWLSLVLMKRRLVK